MSLKAKLRRKTAPGPTRRVSCAMLARMPLRSKNLYWASRRLIFVLKPGIRDVKDKPIKKRQVDMVYSFDSSIIDSASSAFDSMSKRANQPT